MRVPNTGPIESERRELIVHFEKKLTYFEAIPPRRREESAPTLQRKRVMRCSTSSASRGIRSLRRTARAGL